MAPVIQRQQLQQECSRWKHSSTQIKRLFKKNPARARVEARLGNGGGESVKRLPGEPRYPPVAGLEQARILPNGWSAPPPEGIDIPSYPFQITRTRKDQTPHAVGFLPVYSEFR